MLVDGAEAVWLVGVTLCDGMKDGAKSSVQDGRELGESWAEDKWKARHLSNARMRKY